MSYFLDQKNKYSKGQASKYNVQDDSDQRIFDAESEKGGGLSDQAAAAQKRLNDKWASS